MSSGPTSERVYDALKARITTGRFRPGERLEAAAISDALSSSITPVRDALHTLVGEGLVATRTSDGFHIPHIDAPALEDLYRWNNDILALSLRSTDPHDGSVVAGASYPARVAALFAGIAGRSRNGEHLRSMMSLNDRLCAARVAEARILPTCDDELATISAAIASGRASQARQALAAYHRRRVRRTADIVRDLYRTTDLPRTIAE